jgi:hypothetical protein
MKKFNSPAQARNLREIEIAACAPVIKNIQNVTCDVQSVCTAEAPEEAGTEAEAETQTQKTRSKKNTKKV